jgi:hypothetical protein
MDLKSWEATIQEIVADLNHEPRESGKQKVLNIWRAKLEKEPNSVPLFHVDEIVREVRKRITVVG